MSKLTKRQAARLRDIAAYEPTEKWPHAAFWKESATDRSLVKRGLLRRIEHTTSLGGGGAAGSLTATWHLCALTDAGRAALSQAKGESQ